MALLIRLVAILVLLVQPLMMKSQPTEQEGMYYYKQSFNKRLPFQETVAAAKQAVTIFKSLKKDRSQMLAHIQLGILLWHDGQMDTATDHLNRGQLLAYSQNDSLRVAQCLHYKGLTKYYRCLFPDALDGFDQAEKIYLALRADSAVAKVKSHKALIFSVTGLYELSIQNMLESFKLQELMPGYRDQSVEIRLSSAADEAVYYRSKLQKDLESLKFLERKNDSVRLAFTFHNIGMDYQKLKDFDHAITFFKKSSALYRALGHIPFDGDIADVFLQLHQYDSALHYYFKRLADIEQRGTQIHRAALYGSMGSCYEAMGDLHQSLYYFNQAWELNQKIGLRRTVSSTGRARAQLLLKLGQPKEALREIQHSIAIAKEIQSRKDLPEYLMTMSEILTAIGDHAQAAVVLKQSILYKESILEGESQLQVARLQIEYEAEKKSRDLAELQSQNEMKEAEIELRNLQIALALALIGIGTITGGFYLYQYRQKKKSNDLLSQQKTVIEQQNQTLQLQNREKEILISEVHHRVKNNLQIISSLINLKSNQTSSETSEALQQLNSRIYSMGLIHEKLYQHKGIQSLRLDYYLSEISHYLIQSFSGTEYPVQLDFQADPIEWNADQTLACGLICNEVITNSLKHAFLPQQQHRKISVCLRHSNESVKFIIADNGEKDTLANINPNSFGLRFVDQLVRSKLMGKLNVKQERGVITEIVFDLNSNGKNKDHHSGR